MRSMNKYAGVFMKPRKERKKIKRKNSISAALDAIVAVCVFNDNPRPASFAVPLDLKLLNLLKDVRFHVFHLLFFLKE